jgi:hypothetical protein
MANSQTSADLPSAPSVLLRLCISMGPHLITQIETQYDVLAIFDPACPRDAVVINRSF